MRPAYAAAGVDVAAGERAVERMRSAVEATRRPEVLGGLGGFAAALTLPAGLRDPVLVQATDGVGTKTVIAAALGRYDTIGRDVVAMCADDVVCLGATPLSFLDYLAVGRLDPERVAAIVAGVADGCREAGCALVGGETAEHPGLLGADEFDLAGACLGVVERDALLDGTAARPGDAIIGMAVSGLHANGYSLVRALVARHGLALDRPYRDVLRDVLGETRTGAALATGPESGETTLGDVLLAPTRIYAPAVLAMREALGAAGRPLRGLAHVTGGGLPGNVPRALPGDLGALVDPGRWPAPSIVTLMATLGGLDAPEARATFNGGLGMVAVVPRAGATVAVETLAGWGIPAWVVGQVVPVDELDGGRYVEDALRRDPG